MGAQPDIFKPGDVSAGAIAHFAGAFGRAGGSRRGLQVAADNPELMRKIVALTNPYRDNPVFHYRDTPRSMLEAGGYGDVDLSVNAEDFGFGPPRKEGKDRDFDQIVQLPTVQLVQSFHPFSETLKRLGTKRLATLAELLLLGATETSLQREFPIVCITNEQFTYAGMEGGALYPTLTVAGNMRVVTLAFWDGSSSRIQLWGGDWHGPWAIAVTDPMNDRYLPY